MCDNVYMSPEDLAFHMKKRHDAYSSNSAAAAGATQPIIARMPNIHVNLSFISFVLLMTYASTAPPPPPPPPLRACRCVAGAASALGNSSAGDLAARDDVTFCVSFLRRVCCGTWNNNHSVFVTL
jgi:hypothetical protein